MEPVVSTWWLDEHRDEVQLADVRWYLDGRSGRAAFEDAHIPGAVFVDLDLWLADVPAPDRGRHPLPDPKVFASGMTKCGIDGIRPVVAYDDEGGVIAARLVWLLRASGRSAALLDGGISAFQHPLEHGPVTPAPSEFEARAWPTTMTASFEEVIEVARDVESTAVLVDARDRVRYRGDIEPVDARAGHIPGAVSVPCRENLDSDSHLISREAIRQRYENAGITDGAQVISYCGSGVTACHNLLTLEWCGLGVGRLYPGSWSQYSSSLDLPIASGDAP